jgi:predicted 2-oxoglutarate/Fe(II)-dependent dioxygenase YbiX
MTGRTFHERQTGGGDAHFTRPLLIDGLLEPSACARICRAMDAGTPEIAEILDATIAPDDAVRRSSHIDVDGATFAWLDGVLDASRARIEQHFGMTVTGREGISLLRYRPGDFFKPHRDWGIVPSWPDAARRRISLVLFLRTSRDADPEGTFSGGALRLFDDEGDGVCDIHPRAGTLVAFPSTTLHEVAPISDGVRDVIVDWFY